MSRIRTYDIDKVNEVKARLAQLPDKTPRHIKLRETITELTAEIESLLQRGYTMDDIAAELKGDGIGITSATLASYMRPAKQRKSRRRTGPARRQARSQTADTTTPQTTAKTATRRASPSPAGATAETPDDAGTEAALPHPRFLPDKDRY